MKDSSEIYDVAVIGGGPAGMMAAGRAAELGARVILLEKNDGLGKKLLITGGGRCNVTNAELDIRKFLSKFKGSDKFLFSPFSQFSVKDALDFFHKRDMPTKIEAENRAFPASDKAESVWNVLVEYLKQGNVTILSKTPVTGFVFNSPSVKGALHSDEGNIESIKLKNGKIIRAKSYILATGGKSRPETGSTGEGFDWLTEIGHMVIAPNSALVPICIKQSWVKKLQGLSLSNAKLTSFQNNTKQESRAGKMLFTHFGISGPLVLNMSKDIGELLKYGEVTLSLDVMPDYDFGALDKKLQEVFMENQNKKFKNALVGFLPPKLSPLIVELSKIDPEKFVNKISRDERIALGKLLKDMRMTVRELLGVEKAVVTSGGVALHEVDFKTMQSKLYPNLYLVGDILNIDRPSGGYSLQLCWTTGYVAGTDATKK